MTGKEAGQEVINETSQAFLKAGFSSKAIAEELALIAFADMADFIDVDEAGIVRAISFGQLKKNKSRIIKKIREKRVIRTEKGTKDKPDGEQVLDSTFEFELYSKLDALDMAVDVKGLKQSQKIDVTINNLSELISEARKRTKKRSRT